MGSPTQIASTGATKLQKSLARLGHVPLSACPFHRVPSSAAPDCRPPPELAASCGRCRALSPTAGPFLRYRTDAQNSALPSRRGWPASACLAPLESVYGWRTLRLDPPGGPSIGEARAPARRYRFEGPTRPVPAPPRCCDIPC